ncbi:MAG: 50S ribosomal protein L6 [Rickettsiales bacterium]|nr:50S ribosomal protein L6 [Rickettsiales bacterium]|tara:strand:- start:1278 stop:1811 length:534 start_codon:yes stop_codon:yes gene_type:complete
MSRSGRIPINIPENTEVTVNDGMISAKGKLGELSYNFGKNAMVSIKENTIIVNKAGESRRFKEMWGTVRSRIFNVIQGVSSGFVKELELNGVGYKATQKGKILELLLGFSHPINFEIPSDLKIEVPKPNQIKISGIDKQRVGQIAANIRSFRKPEPYKGKGVKYKEEFIRRKEGKKK